MFQALHGALLSAVHGLKSHFDLFVSKLDSAGSKIGIYLKRMDDVGDTATKTG